MLSVTLTLIACVAQAHANGAAVLNMDKVADNVVDELLMASIPNQVNLGMLRQKLCKDAQNFAEAEDRIDHVSPGRRLSTVRSSASAFCRAINSRPVPPRSKTIPN